MITAPVCLWILMFASLLLLACAQSGIPTPAAETGNTAGVAANTSATVMPSTQMASRTMAPTNTQVPPQSTDPPVPQATQPATAATEPAADIWRPKPGTDWQWQLNALPIDLSIDVDMYDIDLFDNDAATVAALHAAGRKAVCYLNAGGWEDWRPDAAEFPEGIIGANLDDWNGERWLDIRRIDLLAPIMEARMDLCRQKGFDGIEPDNIDGFLNDTGFPLTSGHQLEYNIWLAEAAHRRGLSIGLKNDMDQIDVLLSHYDWALNEQCFEYDECETLLPSIEAGKAVFNVEYALETGEFCEKARALGFNSLRKNLDLGSWLDPCG